MAKASKKDTEKQAVETIQAGRSLTPLEEMERMFGDFFPRGWIHPRHWEWPSWPESRLPFGGQAPKVDVIDHEGEIVVRAEVPGVDKDKLEVTMTDNTITIKGTSSHEEKEEKGDYYRCEISRGAFTRTVALPAAVDGSKAKAKMKDGVLEVTLPKVQKSKRHSIEVSD